MSDRIKLPKSRTPRVRIRDALGSFDFFRGRTIPSTSDWVVKIAQFKLGNRRFK